MGPIDGVGGFVEAVVVVDGVEGEVQEDLLGQATQDLQGDEVILPAVVDGGGDGDRGGGIRGEIGPGEGGGEQDEALDLLGILAGEEGGHQAAETGADEGPAAGLAEDGAQLLHTLLQQTGEIGGEDVGEDAAEEGGFDAVAAASEAVDEDES
ncbi:MAG: hypothetical protein P8X95_18600 [Anaerolineales bacterium]